MSTYGRGGDSLCNPRSLLFLRVGQQAREIDREHDITGKMVHAGDKGHGTAVVVHVLLGFGFWVYRQCLCAGCRTSPKACRHESWSVPVFTIAKWSLACLSLPSSRLSKQHAPSISSTASWTRQMGACVAKEATLNIRPCWFCDPAGETCARTPLPRHPNRRLQFRKRLLQVFVNSHHQHDWFTRNLTFPKVCVASKKQSKLHATSECDYREAVA